MTPKETLLQELETTPDNLITIILAFLRFLKTTPLITPDTLLSPNLPLPQSRPLPQTDFLQTSPTSLNAKPNYRPASGRSLLRHAGTWQGDDFDDCLNLVYSTRSKTKFDYDSNPFE